MPHESASMGFRFWLFFLGVQVFPPFNLASIFYQKELEAFISTTGVDADIDNSVAQSYHHQKWVWKVGASFKDANSLNRKIHEQPSDQADVEMVNSASSVKGPTLNGSLWDAVEDISKSKNYRFYMNTLKELEDGGSSGKNYGVTIATTVDATKMTGDQRLRRLRKILSDSEVFGVTRGDIQVMFHEEFIQACLSIIYRGEWDQNFDEIMRSNRVISNARERFIICPRRFGKTWSVAMFCAAFFWCMPNVTVAIFSRGKRMAQKLMYLCIRYLLKLPGFKEFVKTSNSEQVVIQFGPHDIRTLCCLPGTPEVCINHISHARVGWVKAYFLDQ